MQINVNKNKVTIDKGHTVNEGEYNIRTCNFVFSEDYTEDLSKVAVFSKDGKSYKVSIVNNQCIIPIEVLETKGTITIGVYAYSITEENGEEILEKRFSPAPAKIHMDYGSYIKNAENASHPTPTEIEQLDARISAVEIDAQQVEVNKQNIETLQTTKADKAELPTKTSDLTNDNGFIDNSVNNLINYTLTTQTGSKIDLEINSSTYELVAKLYDKNNTLISTSSTIDLPLESMVLNVEYDNTTKELVITLQNGTIRRIPLSDIIDGLVSQTDFDALELRVDTAETDIDTLQSQVETLENQVADLEEQVQELENNQLTGTATGQSIYIEDSTNAKVRDIGLSGNSEQESTTGKNLQNITTRGGTEYGITWVVNEDKSITLNGTNTKGESHFIRLADNYTLSAGTYTLSNGNSNANLNSAIFYDDSNTFARTTTSTATITEDTIMKPYIRIAAGVTLNNFTIYPMVEQGSTATPYEPYTGGQASPNPSYPQEIHSTGDSGSVNEKVQNKNLIGEVTNFSQNAIVNNGVVTQVQADSSTNLYWKFQKRNDNLLIEQFANINKNTTGIISISFIKSDTFNTLVFGLNGSQRDTTVKTDVSSLENGIRYVISFNITNATQGSISWKDIQVEQGTTATDYVAHEEQNISFPLAQGQKLMEGDYLADDGIHHKMGEVVLDGTEDYISFTTQTNSNYVFLLREGIKQNANGLSNYFIRKNYYTEDKVGIWFTPYSTSLIQINFPTSISTLADWKTWLSTHNVKVQYELEEEVIEPYTEAQQAVWEQIKALRTYKPVTHISSTDEVPATVDVTYVKDLETVINNLS